MELEQAFQEKLRLERERQAAGGVSATAGMLEDMAQTFYADLRQQYVTRQLMGVVLIVLVERIVIVIGIAVILEGVVQFIRQTAPAEHFILDELDGGQTMFTRLPNLLF